VTPGRNVFAAERSGHESDLAGPASSSRFRTHAVTRFSGAGDRSALEAAMSESRRSWPELPKPEHPPAFRRVIAFVAQSAHGGPSQWRPSGRPKSRCQPAIRALLLSPWRTPRLLERCSWCLGRPVTRTYTDTAPSTATTPANACRRWRQVTQAIFRHGSRRRSSPVSAARPWSVWSRGHLRGLGIPRARRAGQHRGARLA
jgi:hypothetical protein